MRGTNRTHGGLHQLLHCSSMTSASAARGRAYGAEWSATARVHPMRGTGACHRRPASHEIVLRLAKVHLAGARIGGHLALVKEPVVGARLLVHPQLFQLGLRGIVLGLGLGLVLGNLPLSPGNLLRLQVRKRLPGGGVGGAARRDATAPGRTFLSCSGG